VTVRTHYVGTGEMGGGSAAGGPEPHRAAGVAWLLKMTPVAMAAAPSTARIVLGGLPPRCSPKTSSPMAALAIGVASVIDTSAGCRGLLWKAFWLSRSPIPPMAARA
jgi:hypothetical protein